MYEASQSAITFNNLNLPTYDIHSKQARQQILYNFQKLTESFISISTKHIEKSKQQNQRISKLKDRIINCKQRIQQFQSTNQALIFVSPGEYPKRYKFDPENNVSIFKEYLRKTQVNKLDMSAHYQVKHDIQKLGEQSKLKINELDKFVVFLLGHLQGKKKSIFEKSLHPSRRKQQTLGQIPNGVQYIDSLLLFNSHINPYRKYQITSNAIEKKTQKTKNKQVQAVEKNQILVDRQLVNYTKPGYKQESIQFIRKEIELEMPQFDLDLGLDGIVDYDDLTTGFNMDFNFDQNIQQKTVPQDPYANKNKNQSNKMNSNQPSHSQQNYSNFSTPPTNNLNLPPPPPLNLPPPPALNLPPPLPLNLPPPPAFNLPPPPPLNLTLPSAPSINLPPPPALNLPPPPPLNLPPPPLGLNLPPPPSLSTILPANPGNRSMPPAPALSGRAALLSQLQNPNPMARLKKTVTIQKGGINPSPTIQQSNSNNPNGGNSQQQKPAKQMSFMQALQAKIKRRFDLLNLQQQDQD